MSRPVTLFTGQWADLSFEKMCELAADMGYDGLEIAAWGDHFDADKVNDEGYIQERKEILARYDLDCWAIGSHIIGQCVSATYDRRYDDFAPDELAGQPEEIRKWAVTQMKLLAKGASKMGCEIITGFTGSPIWKYLYSFPTTSQEMVDEAFVRVAEKWSPILDQFDEFGVKFALEVHPTEIAFDYYTTEKILKAFDYRDTFGLNFDPSHLIWQGVDPHIFLRDFADRIYHVHMKDAAVTLDGKSGILASHLPFGDRRRGWDFRSLGHGDVDFEEIIRELNAMNYTGPLSVEWEDSGMDREYGAREAAQFVRDIDFEPSDLAFDESMEK